MKSLKSFFMKYKQSWVLLYMGIYFPWFYYLEKHVTSDYYLIHSGLDSKIPFCEYFIVPYLLWFIFIAGTVVWFLFKESKASFYQLTGILFGGMTICLAICTVFPNGLAIRPNIDASKNVFTWLTAMIYSADTPTNVFPSIHVFTSIVAQCAISHSLLNKKHPWISRCTGALAISIVLSTMFLKQHSVIDVTGGILLAFAMYEIIYKRESVLEEKPRPSSAYR